MRAGISEQQSFRGFSDEENVKSKRRRESQGKRQRHRPPPPPHAAGRVHVCLSSLIRALAPAQEVYCQMGCHNTGASRVSESSLRRYHN